ncbi:MAG: hypothetical protein ACODAE_09865 [Gemmatimonadota bacterium]
MEMLFHAHSGIRYLVLLAGLVAALYALVGWTRSAAFDRTGRLLGRVFVGALDLQVLLGLILLIETFYPRLIGHITMMILAAVAAHGFAVAQKRRRAEERSFALQFSGIALSLLLIVGGILAIGQPIV